MAKHTHNQPSTFIVNQYYPPDYAPTGQLIHELVRYLGERNHSIRVFTGQPGYVFSKKLAPPLEIFHNVIIQRTRATSVWGNRIRGKAVNGILFFVRSFLHLLRHVKRKDVLLLTTAPPFLPILGYLLHCVTGAAYICLVYDLYPDVAENLGVVSSGHWTAKLWDWFNCRTWNSAKKVIVLSETMKNQILAKQPHLAHKIEIISNWADPNWIVPIDKKDNWFAQEFDLTDKFTVLYSGNMGRCHDMETILCAARELDGEKFRFVFIGGGAQYESSQERVHKLGLTNCLFMPYQDREVLPFSLTACDLSLVSVEKGMSGVVAPSKLYSVLATGRPLAAICDSECFLRDMVQKLQCGLSFANGDSQGLAQFIREMATQSELAEAMGQAGRNYLMANCTLETIGKQYVAALGLSADAAPREVPLYRNEPDNVDSVKVSRPLF